MKRSQHLLAGLFLIIGVLLFAASIWILGNERQIFAHQEEYYTVFSDVKGLAEGAPVRLGGITIGRVKEIGFSNDLSDQRIHVTLLVNAEFLERIRGDSEVNIETQGLLGDRFIGISVGHSGEQLPPRSVIRSAEGGDLTAVVDRASTLVDNVKRISDSLSATLEEFRGETLKNLSETSQNLASITAEIKNGKGPLHGLVYGARDGSDPLLGVSSAARDAGAILKDIKNGPGLLHDLIYDKGAAERGSLSEIMSKLDATAENVRRASEALAQGSGTLGALLIDPQLYENLVEVTDGAKRSFILRKAIRSSLQK